MIIYGSPNGASLLGPQPDGTGMPAITLLYRWSTVNWNWSAPGGRRWRSQLRHGKSYFRNASVEYDVINAGAGVMTFIEIELKDTGEANA